MLTIPTSLPPSITGTWEISYSRIKPKTAPTLRFDSNVWGARVMTFSISVLPHPSATAPWITFSSVTNPSSLPFSNIGSCRMPLPIINFANALKEISGVTTGATCISERTLATVGSSRDRKIDRLVIIPIYLPFSSKTAKTGGIPFLKLSRHLESVSFSWTELNPLE